MQFEGAVIKEQGITFAVVVVKSQVVADASQAQQAVRAFSGAFPGLPVVVMGQDHRGTPTYYGRRDIVNFLANVPVSSIPWRKYTWN